MNIFYPVFSLLVNFLGVKLPVNRKETKEAILKSQQLVKALYIRQEEMHHMIQAMQVELAANKVQLEQKLQELQQTEAAGKSKELEIKCLTRKTEELYTEIEHKNNLIHELIQSNTRLEEKINQIFSDLSTSIHLN